jgi:hypothetical protein
VKQLKMLCLLVFAVLAIGVVTAASASALPATLALSGETTGEVELKAESTTAKSTFFGISQLKGKGYLFELFGK